MDHWEQRHTKYRLEGKGLGFAPYKFVKELRELIMKDKSIEELKELIDKATEELADRSTEEVSERMGSHFTISFILDGHVHYVESVSCYGYNTLPENMQVRVGCVTVSNKGNTQMTPITLVPEKPLEEYLKWK